ncbi:hypothetical protein DFA_06626 [Cavenderia fasciculata]|uniref:Uncharacterized protein n=1 Tax=Cavenderia fasciculata TaxID=261658 RepID=F4Q1U0_CACFS|nr:uncharacterized protein DFA_06626 [Cavenderia fasciculata]EGG17960.1 hypothetical protein DFA_06626 [Cavenderia fasciculata]|eukprot:XP_004356852.1 hypothetical protein DFA_06626 [Cavenderia fasciculata]
MDAIVTKMEETLERKKSIVYIVEKRTNAIDYIRRIHESAYYQQNSKSPLHWMNVANIQKIDFEKSIDIQKRLIGWFSLGLSLAPLLSTDKGPAFVRALVQLMEEYDYQFELGSAMQGVKVLLAKKQQSHTVVSENEHIKSKIVKTGNAVIYEFLKVFNISIAKDLDYFHVVFSLLEILEQIYKKFDKETCSSKYVYDAILKIDSRLKHQIFGFLSKEIDKMASQIIREQLEFINLCTTSKDPRDMSQQSKLSSSSSSSSSTTTPVATQTTATLSSSSSSSSAVALSNSSSYNQNNNAPSFSSTSDKSIGSSD